MTNDTRIERLLNAGSEYQGALEALRTHHHAYKKMTIDIGVREQHALQAGKRAIKLPAMPAIEEHEMCIAEQLIELATQLSHRPCRLNPGVKREELACIIPIRSKMNKFSPLALAQELAGKMLGDGALKRIRASAISQLKGNIKHSRAGLGLCVDDVTTTTTSKGRMIDTMASQVLYDWLASLGEALELRSEKYLLSKIECLLQDIESVGQATIGPRHMISDGDMIIRLSLRRGVLRVFLSDVLIELVTEFISTENNVSVTRNNEPPEWFRSQPRAWNQNMIVRL